jgi:hypothetical protein
VTWLPADFVHPERVAVDDAHHLRPITPDDVELDLAAVMGSRERLFSIYGASWGWPPVGMTVEQDRDDLRYHAEEMASNSSFNYALFDADETALLGCVYIDPGDTAAADTDAEDAVVSWWTIDALVGTPFAAAFDAFVPAWLARDWPLERVRIGVSAPVSEQPPPVVD